MFIVDIPVSLLLNSGVNIKLQDIDIHKHSPDLRETILKYYDIQIMKNYFKNIFKRVLSNIELNREKILFKPSAYHAKLLFYKYNIKTKSNYNINLIFEDIGFIDYFSITHDNIYDIIN